jgi:Flp pilus assembly protein TadG
MKALHRWRDESGATALEFALTAPAFFLLLFGIIEAGLLFWTQLGLQHGAELAARCATVNRTICSDANATTTYATQQALGLTLPAGTFTYSSPSCGNQVSGSYSFPLPGFLGVGPITLAAQACFPA